METLSIVPLHFLLLQKDIEPIIKGYNKAYKEAKIILDYIGDKNGKSEILYLRPTERAVQYNDQNSMAYWESIEDISANSSCFEFKELIRAVAMAVAKNDELKLIELSQKPESVKVFCQSELLSNYLKNVLLPELHTLHHNAQSGAEKNLAADAISFVVKVAKAAFVGLDLEQEVDESRYIKTYYLSIEKLKPVFMQRYTFGFGMPNSNRHKLSKDHFRAVIELSIKELLELKHLDAHNLAAMLAEIELPKPD